MTKKFRIWGLVQDRLSPVFVKHAQLCKPAMTPCLQRPVHKLAAFDQEQLLREKFQNEGSSSQAILKPV